jgi:hypothetical protein
VITTLQLPSYVELAKAALVAPAPAKASADASTLTRNRELDTRMPNIVVTPDSMDVARDRTLSELLTVRCACSFRKF